MELREPPRPAASARPDRLVRGLLVAVLAALVGLVALLGVRGSNRSGATDPERSRELASRLKAAGALDEAAVHYERYLNTAELDAESRARIAYSLGSTLLDNGDYEKALRWFYEAELAGTTELSEELGRKIVHTLERLGRFHSAQAALESRVRLEDPEGGVQRAAGDPLVARIGDETIYRSDVERALDQLPPEVSRSIRTAADRQEFARQYVAEELLWRKARKLEYDRDAEVVRRHESALRQLAVARLVEDEVAAKVQVDESDLRNFFQANLERYQRPASDGAQAQAPSFDEARQVVERDYRMSKMQSAYQELIETELATESVEVFAEAMGDGA